MLHAETCPRCHLELGDSRKQGIPAVCNHCGYVLTDSQARAEKDFRTSSFIAITTFAAFLVLLITQLSHWGGYFVEVRWLQFRSMMGNSIAVSERMAAICMDLKKYDCVEEAYAELGQQDPRLLSKLGHFQMARADYEGAARAYAAYVATGNPDLESVYLYAKALAETGQIEKAAENFETVIRAKPEVLQITVVQNYVKYLMRADRFDQAAEVITRMRKLDQTKSSFMDSEFRTINEKRGLRG